MSVTWKSKGMRQEYRIFRDKIIVGIFKKEGWKSTAYGEFNGAMLRFKPKSFWNTGTVIYDIEGENQLGTIEYNSWKSTGSVVFQGQTFEWKYDSRWKRNKWTISNGADFAAFHITSIWKGEGEIEIEGIPAALVIIGLYIHDHFETMTTAVIIAST